MLVSSNPKFPWDMICTIVLVFGFPFTGYLGHKFGELQERRKIRTQLLRKLQTAIDHGFLCISIDEELSRQDMVPYSKIIELADEVIDEANIISRKLSELNISEKLGKIVNPVQLEHQISLFRILHSSYELTVDDLNKLDAIFDTFKENNTDLWQIIPNVSYLKITPSICDFDEVAKNRLLVDYGNDHWQDLATKILNQKLSLESLHKDIEGAIEASSSFFSPWERLLKSILNVRVGLRVPFHRLSELVEADESHVEKLMTFLLTQYPDLGLVDLDEKYYEKQSDVSQHIEKLLSEGLSSEKLKKL